jgi:hypothetical protein
MVKSELTDMRVQGSYWNFILVGCILLRNVYIALLNIHLQSQLRVLLTYSFLVTHLQKYNIIYCDSPEDGPKGPKHVVSGIEKNTSIKLSVAIAGVCLINLYILTGRSESSRRSKEDKGTRFYCAFILHVSAPDRWPSSCDM